MTVQFVLQTCDFSCPHPTYSKNFILRVKHIFTNTKTLKDKKVSQQTSNHDPVNAGSIDTSLHVSKVLDVPVGDHRDVDGPLHGRYLRPVGQARVRSFLLACSTMDGEKLKDYFSRQSL